MKARRDRSEGDEKLTTPKKKILDDSRGFVAQTEPSEDYTKSYMYTEKTDRKRTVNQELKSQSHSKANKSQMDTSSGKKKRTGGSKTKLLTVSLILNSFIDILFRMILSRKYMINLKIIRALA